MRIGVARNGVAKIAVAALALVAGLATVALPATAAPREIRIGTISAANSPWDLAMRRFAEVAAKESDGELKVLVYTDGQLGDIQQMFSGMQLGTLEMGYFGLGSAVLLKGADPLNILYVPYLFKDKDWTTKILNNDEFKKIYDDVAKNTGVRIVGAFGARSPRALQTVKGPITKPEDVKGLRLRIPSIPALKATFEALGAQVTPLGMLEIYNGLSRGMIDGQDNGFDLSVPLKFHEVAKHWSATDHAYEMTGWFISERLWQSLTPTQREALTKAAAAGGEVSTEATNKLDRESIEALKAAGVTYTEPDREAFRTALKDVYKQFEGKMWPAGLVDRIRAMQQ
jgi:tripartite ATP-independent transporter DctP family solute receptor